MIAHLEVAQMARVMGKKQGQWKWELELIAHAPRLSATANCPMRLVRLSPQQMTQVVAGPTVLIVVANRLEIAIVVVAAAKNYEF